jgi:hypothetical protein
VAAVADFVSSAFAIRVDAKAAHTVAIKTSSIRFSNNMTFSP